VKPLILVTNDDGVYSKGILDLFRAIQTIGKAVIVAPDREKSAVSHSLTLHRPLKIEKIEQDIYALNGTPTDCVTIAVSKVLQSKPDLVLSGINRGGNLGDDITYSGTVSAAIEGTILGIPSMAVSLAGEKDYRFSTASKYAKKIAQMILDEGLPDDTLLNVNVPNVPAGEINGAFFTRQGKRIYDNAVQEMLDPRGAKHYWIGGGIPLWKEGIDTDFYAVKKGYVSITPIHLDLTNFDALDLLKNGWNGRIK
jgi:5'-nucleotidase